MAKILVIDCGGSGFRSATVDGTNITNLQTRPGTSVEGLINFASDSLPDGAQGVSYAMAGVIANHETIIKSPNSPFLNGTNLANLTRQKLKLPVVVCNDMEAAINGMGEMFPELNYFMGITWCSGIGLRVMVSGKILCEAEGGHAQLDPSPFAPLCGCGKRGCAEAVLGGSNLIKRVLNETATRGIKIPSDYEWPTAFLHESLDKGEPWAVEIYSSLTFGMARFLANIQSLFHLPAIVWKGTLAKQVVSRKEPEIFHLMENMLIDPTWARTIKPYHCWQVEPHKDADSLIGGARVLTKMLQA